MAAAHSNQPVETFPKELTLRTTGIADDLGSVVRAGRCPETRSTLLQVQASCGKSRTPSLAGDQYECQHKQQITAY